MRYTTLLFDLDHTLFDSDASEAAAFDAALRANGVDASRAHFKTFVEINKELWISVERGAITPAQVRVTRFERLIGELGLDADPVPMADAFVRGLGAYGDLYPGARGLLERLARKATLAMITNGLGESQRARIERLRLEEYFEAIVISEEVGAAKPGGEIFDATFRALGFPAKDTALILGDNVISDIGGGAGYGIATCWYNPHGRTADAGPSPDYEIERLDQFPAVVLGENEAGSAANLSRQPAQQK